MENEHIISVYRTCEVHPTALRKLRLAQIY